MSDFVEMPDRTDRTDRGRLVARGRIVLLNGTSSSGKSTLAKSLQKGFAQAHLHLQLDAFRAMEPPGYFDGLSREHRKLRIAAVCRAMNAASAQYAFHGQHVILDHVVAPGCWQYLVEDLREFAVYLIGVRCDLQVLQEREARRNDRPTGLAESQFSMHEHMKYDFEVDTSGQDDREIANRLLAWFEAEPQPRAFHDLVKAHER